MKRIQCLIVLLACGSPCSAEMTALFSPTFEEGGSTPPAGYVTHDLVVSTTTDWLAANLVLTLDQGSVYQDPLLVGIGPPSSALVNAIPSTRWDTYLTGASGLAGGAPSSAGGAVDLGGKPLGTFSDSAIDINWFTTSLLDIGTFSIGRFTLSSDATGTYELRLDAFGQAAPLFLTGNIAGGNFEAVPEASGLLLMLLGAGLGVTVFRRRRGKWPETSTKGGS